MNLAIEIIATFTDAVYMATFIPAILGVSIKRKRWAIIFPSVYFAAQLLFDTFLPGFELLPMAVLFFLVLVYAVLLCKDRIAWCIFISCIFVIVMMLVSTLLFSVFSIYLPDPQVLLQGSKTSVRILIILIGKVMLFACYQLLSKLFSKEKNIVNFNAILMLGLSFGTALGLSVLMKIAAVIETDNANLEIVILAIVLVGINVLFYVLISQNQKLQKHKYESQLMAERILMKGNEAIAEAAIRAGCRHYFGYPITPQTEIAAFYIFRHSLNWEIRICVNRIWRKFKAKYQVWENFLKQEMRSLTTWLM